MRIVTGGRGRTVLGLSVIVVIVIGLSGCTSGGGEPPVGGGSTGEPPPAAVRTSDGNGPDGNEPDGNGPVIRGSVSDVPKELCAFLEKQGDELQDRTSGLSAAAGFVKDYAIWIGEDANRLVSDLAELDVIANATCPKAREQVLEVLNRDSLAKVLGLKE